MLIYRFHRRWFTPLVSALIAVALLMSTSSAQVRADSPQIMPDMSWASVHGNDNPDTSMSLLIGTATATRTPTPPFICSIIWLSNKRLVGNQFQIDIQNDNSYPAVISRIQITWPNIPAFAQMGLAEMSLNTFTMWNGPDPQVEGSTTTTDTDTKPGNPPFSSASTSNRTIDALAIGGYAAAFNIPQPLTSYVTPSRYAITFTIDNPLNPSSPCVLTSPATVPTATPTVAGGPSPTPTPTPNCSSNFMAIKFNSFDNFGIVRFDILSQRNVPSTLKGFNINWQKYVNSQKLRQVSLGAPPGQTGAVVVWDSGDVNQDTTPPTNSHNQGIWLADYTVPDGSVGAPSVTPIYFDFEGIYRYDDYSASTDPHYGGASDFNFSTFELTCGTTSGGTPTSQITPESLPTPTFVPTRTMTDIGAPTATSTPTSTPTATYTASPTFTPSKTVTMGPSLTTTITITNTATPTPSETPTVTLTPTSTLITPTSPANAVPRRNFYTTHTPTLTWNSVTWATGYKIQISSDQNFSPASTFTRSLLAGTLNYTIDPLANGTYYWRVMALGGTVSNWSIIGSFVISDPEPEVTP